MLGSPSRELHFSFKNGLGLLGARPRGAFSVRQHTIVVRSHDATAAACDDLRKETILIAFAVDDMNQRGRASIALFNVDNGLDPSIALSVLAFRVRE